MKTLRGWVSQSYGNHKWRKQGLNPKLPGLKAHPLSIILLLHVANLEMKKSEEKSLNSPLSHCKLGVMGV